MSPFQPTRASPRPKSVNISDPPPHRLPNDISRSSTVSVPELMALSQNEIELIDAVIKRAGPSATTFLTIFKAYNDVLKERGLDPHEVLYYGKLLKLGTMKGNNWDTKWSAVKSQFNQGSHGTSDSLNQSHGRRQALNIGLKSASKRVVRHVNLVNPSHQFDDTFTLHSHEDESDKSFTAENDVDASLLRFVPDSNQNYRALGGLPSSNDTRSNPSSPVGAIHTPYFRQPKLIPNETEVSDYSEGVPSTTPPSYHAAIYEARKPEEPHRPPPISGVRKRSFPIVTSSSTARKVVAAARDRRGGVVNEEDAWKKIKMQRDEIDADQFRSDRLQERCWEVWKQGFQWILTTNRQIREARDNLLLRLSLQRWRNITVSHTDLYRRIVDLSNRRYLKITVEVWKARLKEKEQRKWREAMRFKMKTIKAKREMQLLKDMWAKWCQSYRLRLSGHQYTKQLGLRFYHQWKRRLSQIIEYEAFADNFFNDYEQRIIRKCWSRWRDASDIKDRERIMTERIELRLMGETLLSWYKHARDYTIAKEFHRSLLIKSTIRSWKSSRDRIQNMETRATKHVTRQEGVLLRAVARVWKARERGNLLERVKAKRLLKNSWSIWRYRVQELRQHDDLAFAFSLRGRARLVTSVLHGWREVYTTHRNSQSFAVQYNTSQIQYRIILFWRIRLRGKLKLGKMARRADRIFASRRAWNAWVNAMKMKVVEKRIGELERRWLERAFQVWLHRSRQRRERKIAEQTIKAYVTKHILKQKLAVWTNRVIEIKLRELEVVQRYKVTKLILAFRKWQGLHARHVEELSLMESYQIVKREEAMRRSFHRWLSLALTTRRRRLTLQQKEDEINFSRISVAWDKWRDRFSDEKLRPIEYNVVLQSRKNLSFRAFGIWHSRTKSLPAIRFYVSNTKFKFFRIWRGEMPRALQAKKAREVDKKIVLAKFMEKWLQSLRTKMALKAVARARYLRLPTAAPRQPYTTPISSPATHQKWPPPHKLADEKPIDMRIGPVSLLSRVPQPLEQSPVSMVTSPRVRNASPAGSRSSLVGRKAAGGVSPTRSAFGSGLSTGSGEGGRSRLWLELHQVQRRSGPPSSTREPL